MNAMVISIRKARSDDAGGLSAVFDAAWREAYLGIIPGIALDRLLSRRGPRWWSGAVARPRPLVVFDIGQSIAGYCSYGRCRDRGLPAEGEIDEIYFSPEYQGCGFGSRMLRAVRNDLAARGMKRVLVWSLAENERARAFYESRGGEIVARASERIAGIELQKVAYLFR